MFKGPEVGVCLAGQEASVAGSEWGRRGVQEEGIEVTDQTP